MKNYYLGIDGGGTKTALCLIDEEKNICDLVNVGPSSIDTVSLEEMKSNIALGINKLNYQGKIVSCFAGIGGITGKEDAKKVSNSLRDIQELKEAKIDADNDVINALMGGIGKEDGIICIIGTGSVCFGSHFGKTHRAGGYCYQEGDAGSSYDLGRKALQHLARVYDKRAKASPFSEELMTASQTDGFVSLTKYFIHATRTEVANLAKVVTRHSENKVAKEIIETAVSEIILMIETVFRELEFKNTELAIIGSLGNAKTYYREFLKKKLAEELPNITWIESRNEAYYGAALKALYQIRNAF